MAKKVKLNAYVDEDLARQFKAVSKVYYGRMGMCLSAAMLQFLMSDPKEQAELIKRVFDAELAQEMMTAVEAAKEEQFRRINAREKRTRADSNPLPTMSPTPPRDTVGRATKK